MPRVSRMSCASCSTSDGSAAAVAQREPVADPDAEALGLPRPDLEDATRAASARHAPWPEPVRDPHDRQVRGEEHRVDGEAHEEHVDHPERVREQDAVAGRDALAAEQALGVAPAEGARDGDVRNEYLAISRGEAWHLG